MILSFKSCRNNSLEFNLLYSNVTKIYQFYTKIESVNYLYMTLF